MLEKGTTGLIRDSALVNNSAVGSNARAGAVLSGARNLALAMSTIEGNIAHATDGQALGGGLYLQLGVCQLERSSLIANIAQMGPSARRANAGGAYVAQGGTVKQSQRWNNGQCNPGY